MKIMRIHIEGMILHLNPGVKKEQLNWGENHRLEIICEHGKPHLVFSPVGLKDFVKEQSKCCSNKFTTIRIIVNHRKAE